MKTICRALTPLVLALLLLALFTGCDSDGGGRAEEEAILESGIVSPSADITVAPGQSVEFHGYAAGGGTPYVFLWDFDGAGAGSGLKDPGSVVFAAAGVYEVTFTVTDANGIEMGDSVVVSVQDQVSDPLVVADIVSPPVNETVRQNSALTFAGAVNGGTPPYTYLWDFDGAAVPSTEKNPGSITFSTVGTYTVVFTARDAGGRTDTDLVTIGVSSPTGLYWVGVAAGGDHSAALRSDGTLWAWGDNAYGQVGTGTTIDHATPQRVGNITNWTAVALGTYHCVALRADGTLWAWGANHRGQLGRGGTRAFIEPVRVGSDRDWAAVAAGALHSAALKNDGTLWVWGANTDGQVGTGGTEDHDTPRQVGAGHRWVDVAAGAFHTLALRSDRTVWVWGKTFTDVPMQASSDEDWAAVAGGYGGTVALKTGGSLWTWGMVPVRLGSGTDWTAPVTAGRYHAAVLHRDGSLWTWGSNLSGQLGIEGIPASSLPVRVGQDRNWTSVAAGYSHTLGLKADGTIWAWGLNASGQLGIGGFVNSFTPARVR